MPINKPTEWFILCWLFVSNLESSNLVFLKKENLTSALLHRNTAGFVYLHFDSVAAATAAQRALHGRWFAGKMITATFMVRG